MNTNIVEKVSLLDTATDLRLVGQKDLQKGLTLLPAANTVATK
jgi:hypothetical protein